MAAEGTRPGTSGSSLSPDLVAQRGFPTARRGFDPGEVKAFLGQVADELRALRQREAGLERSRRDAEERAAHPTFDERTLMAAVGEETASILGSARAAAADIRAKAEENAARILKDGHDRAAAMREESETVLSRRTAEAEAVAARIVAAATADAERVRDAARQEMSALRARAEADRNQMVDAAQGARDRILSDLTRRRKIAMVQIEQLRAGRDRLLSAYKVVRGTLDEVTGELQRADAEARAAAEAAGRRPPVSNDDDDDANLLQVMGAPGPEGGAGAAPEVEADVDLRQAPEPSRGGELGAGGAGDRQLSGHPGRDTGSGGPPPGGATEIDPGGQGVAVEAGQTRLADERRVGSLRAPRRHKEGREAPDRPGEPPRPGVAEGLAAVLPAGGPAPERTATGPAGPEGAATAGDLFARIRADRAGALVEAGEPAAPAVADDRAGPDHDELTGDGDLDSGVSAEDEAILQRRDEAVGEIESGLARRLKRVLQDEQNNLLDRMRALGTVPTASLVLPEVSEDLGRFVAAGQPLLEQAAQAGAEFARSFPVPEGQVPAGPADPGQLAEPADQAGLAGLADELAAAVVAPLRRRLEQAFADGRDDDAATLADSVGAAYREWKSPRIERTAADHVASAFARGAYAATPDGTRLRWLVDDVDGPCPDCDDNTLAGGVPKGEPFPTGQQWPPAHAGCRCVLVPETG